MKASYVTSLGERNGKVRWVASTRSSGTGDKDKFCVLLASHLLSQQVHELFEEDRELYMTSDAPAQDYAIPIVVLQLFPQLVHGIGHVVRIDIEADIVEPM